jgi:hypothetical protein
MYNIPASQPGICSGNVHSRKEKEVGGKIKLASSVLGSMPSLNSCSCKNEKEKERV